MKAVRVHLEAIVGRRQASRATLAAALLFAVSSQAVRSEDPPVFRPLAATSGLSSQVIVTLVVDRNGFLWAGTRDGLFRYDGYRATRYFPGAAKPSTISDLDIRTIYEDHAGRIWIATNTAGLNLFTPEQDSFVRYRHRSGDPTTLSHDSVYGLADGPEGDLWVGTQVGLNRLDRATGRFTRYLHDPDDPSSLSNNYVFPLLLDRSRTLWVGTVGGGLNRWEESTQSFTRFDLNDLASGDERSDLNHVFALCEDDDRSLWVGTGAGLVRIAAERDDLSLYSLEPTVDREPQITSIVRGPDGRLWLGTVADGLIALDPVTGESSSIWRDPTGSGGTTQPVASLATLGDALVVGTWGSGVYLGRPGASPFRLLGPSEGPDRLRNGTVTSVLATGTPGHPWVGTFGGGPQRVDAEVGVAIELPGEENDLWSLAVLALARTKDDTLYAGTEDGLWELSPSGAAVRRWVHDPDDDTSLGRGYVTSLLPSARGGLWIGVGGGGLYRLDEGAQRFSARRHEPGVADSLSGDYVTALLEEESGQLWVGTRSNGLNLCTIEPWSCRRFFDEADSPESMQHHSVTSLFRDRSARVWVGTDGGGVYEVLRGKRGEPVGFRRWDRGAGFVADSVMAIAGEDEGWLWMSTRDGLARLHPESGEVVSYVAETGLQVTHFSKNAAAADDRYLYFGAIGGLVSLPRGQLPPVSPTAAPTRITAIESFDASNPSVGAAWQQSSHALPYGSGLSVQFAVLDFSESPHEYEYRLAAEDEWTHVGPRREVTIFGLAPGSYSFEVRGRDAQGRWSHAPPVALDVIPPFWMTSSFRLLVLLGVVLAALGAHALRLRSLRRRNSELLRMQQGLTRLANRLESAKEEERRHLSRELHDELGQNLTAAKINLEMLKRESNGDRPSERVTNAVKMVENMIDQVRSISLSLRPPLLDEAGLVPALEHYLLRLTESTGVPISFDSPTDLPVRSKRVATVLFRVIQEAVSNSLRHSGASDIRVSLEETGGVLYARVEDNGCGFDVADVNAKALSGEHLGLLGMRERLRDLGGSVDLGSSPGAGARLEARVPL